MRKLAGTAVSLLATTVVTFGGTAAWATPCTGSCIEKTGAGAVSRQMPWEASGLPVRPAGGAEPEGGYQPD
ncbi:hypothetical protein HD597_004059 [Nonomuraea thailandensis]|uniref:Uncharacterized protein n=1 Tax=Nonomuraea thailandensis TaxID=1188745 RepID=A0A9X2K257_9ACTN|nr:hypothetical protein [Nonomuraea thailandensis]MCP2357039.1 hypothetical protein [Nonomuraea thailandensis]